MAQRRQDAAFGVEAVRRTVGEPGAQQLDCHPLLELALHPFGQVDDPHAAAAELVDDAVVADPVPGPRVGAALGGRQHRVGEVAHQASAAQRLQLGVEAVLLAQPQQLFDRPSQLALLRIAAG